MEGDRSEIVAREDVRISIHALRVEGDPLADIGLPVLQNDFYPRPPGGGRHDNSPLGVSIYAFLSTPSGWRATDDNPTLDAAFVISIHALRVEGDAGYRGNRTGQRAISIHALRVEGDAKDGTSAALPTYDFYPRPPGGGRQQPPPRS